MALSSLIIKQAFKSAGGFLFAQWKWIVLSIVALVILICAFKVYGAFKDRDALLEEREGKVTLLVKRNTELEMEKQSLENTVSFMRSEQVRINVLREEFNTKLDDIYNEVAEQKKIFLDHDFTKLSNAKPGLIIDPINDATKERFDEIADVFNN